MKKDSCTPINPKKYSCYGLKKIHTRNLSSFDNETKFLRLENSPPPRPRSFLMVRPLREPCFEKRSALIIITELIAPYQGKSGFRNPGNFCLWNPKCGKIFLWNQESWALESGTWLQESGIPLTIGIQDLSSTDQESGIQYLESEIHGVESRIQDWPGFPFMGLN